MLIDIFEKMMMQVIHPVSLTLYIGQLNVDTVKKVKLRPQQSPGRKSRLRPHRKLLATVFTRLDWSDARQLTAGLAMRTAQESWARMSRLDGF